jgi:gluconokinase
MAYIIGIDIGTGSTKAVAVNTSGEAIYNTQVSYPTLHPEPDQSEQAPELIWQAFVKCVSRTVDALESKPAAIVLSSAMHSVIALDKAGTPLMNMIIWADNRSASIATRIKDSPQGKLIYEQTGTPIHAMSPLSKIVWLKENKAALFQNTSKFISIKEYIWNKLFGVYEVDYSIASATGLFQIESLSWNADSMRVCNIQGSQLSQPVPPNHSRTVTDHNLTHTLKVAPETPIYIGSSDGCMANIGSFAIEPGTAALTIGTSGAIRVANSTPVFNFKAMTFTYCLFKDLFICGGPINNGGVVLKWYAESFLKVSLTTGEDYESLLGEIETVSPGANGLIFLPYLLGERAPIWSSDSCGVFFGLRNYHTQAHFTRAVVEGISMALYSIAKAMEEPKLYISRINVSGGFVRSTVWLQILADVFNKEIGLIHEEDASAMGAAFLGLKSEGFIEEYNQLKPSLQTTFTPNEKNHEVYERVYGIYERLYPNLKDEMVHIQSLRD